MHHRQPRAFTLIELLVVISIIALLMAILLPTLKTVRIRVMVMTCMAQLQQIGVGLSNLCVGEQRCVSGAVFHLGEHCLHT